MKMDQLSLPVNNPLMILVMMTGTIVQIKMTPTQLMQSQSVQAIVVSLIVKTQISLPPAKSWQLQSVFSLVKHGMYRHSGSVNTPGLTLCETRNKLFCYYCSVAERRKLMTSS